MKKKILISLSGIFLTFILWTVHHIFTYISPPSLLYIPHGNIDTVIKELNRQGLSLNLLDYRLLKRYRLPAKGWFRFDTDKKLLREEFIQQLSTKKREPTRRIVMYSSYTLEEFSEKTALQTRLNPKDLISQYHRYSPFQDAGIIAGYYAIPYQATASSIMYYMVSKSQEQFSAIAEKYLFDYNTDAWKRILTIASIIQKETWKDAEMPIISSVIYNRLKDGLRLQMDATLNYGDYSHQVITPKRIQEDKSRYNTYQHNGLPPKPIGSVSKAALIAAIKPADTKYKYFMLNHRGTHDFSKTYKEHLANIQRYKKERQKVTKF